ncbi:MAG: rhamnulokinase [Planctomycetes bacterium]|nr:rhamnulokinase [Planctomycetota bacterium]
MVTGKKYLAFDLGASSGRAIAGILDKGRLTLDILHRFSNGPVRIKDTLHWDVLGVFRELSSGLLAYSHKYGRELDAIGTDSWGVDYGLLGKDGSLIANPVHYRDSRTDGMPEALFKVVPKKELYRRTGIQVMQLNTIYQLFSMVRNQSPLLDLTDKILCMADLQNYFFTGEMAQEFTLATTTQMYDPNESDWAGDILQMLGIPTDILPDVVAPGSIVGNLTPVISQEYGVNSCPVIAPACHDTAAAVAAVPAEGEDWLYLSSGTWSLLGAEVTEPVINDKTEALNFTNEGGVDGTFRLLKNINGLWIIQECRRIWGQQGIDLDFAELTKLASEAKPFAAVIDPNAEAFMAPGDMPELIAKFCKDSAQSVPQDRGAVVRIALESLALAYRQVVENIEEITGKKYNVLHIVGGGTQNRLLNQLAADATGMLVKTGPVEATAFGNCLMQAIAIGDIGSLAEAREIVRNSISVDIYEPSKERGVWDEAYAKYRSVCR